MVFLSGFKTIIDLAFAPNGDLYVLEHASGAGFSGPGHLIRVAPNGTRALILDTLTRPTSLLIDDDGVIYVARARSVGVGEVLKIEL